MNNEYIDNMMKRYVYDVVRRLPKGQREDIEKELYTLIEDMLNERTGDRTPENHDIDMVLSELGAPADMARQYRGEQRHLIGGEYYEQYCSILKIVLICSGIGLFISNIASFFIKVVASDASLEGFTKGILDIGMIPFILIQVFAWITIVFAIIERLHVNVDLGMGPWDISKLPDIPHKKVIIKRGESIAGIVFGVLCIIMFVFVPQLMGAWVNLNGKVYSIPIFNLSIWRVVLPLFIICIVLGIIRDTVALISGRYNKLVAVTTVITNTIGLIITIIIFKVFDIWNPNFLIEIENVFKLTPGNSYDLMALWNTPALTNMCLGVFTLLYIIDSVVSVYYTVRYQGMIVQS